MSKFIIRPDQHVFIPGMNGSGKTFLAEHYLAFYKNVWVLDTKGFIEWNIVPDSEKTLITDIRDLPHADTPKVIFRPDFTQMTQEIYNEFYRLCYFRTNTIVWTDEVMEVCPSPQKYPEYLKGILTRGRQRNVAHWGLTQRPSGIPLVVMSEATHYFVFDLNLPHDRERIVEITGYEEFYEKPGRTKHGIPVFWYWNAKTNLPPKKGYLDIRKSITRKVVK